MSEKLIGMTETGEEMRKLIQSMLDNIAKTYELLTPLHCFWNGEEFFISNPQMISGKYEYCVEKNLYYKHPWLKMPAKNSQEFIETLQGLQSV
jgi:hypothetical protein